MSLRPDSTLSIWLNKKGKKKKKKKKKKKAKREKGVGKKGVDHYMLPQTTKRWKMKDRLTKNTFCLRMNKFTTIYLRSHDDLIMFSCHDLSSCLPLGH